MANRSVVVTLAANVGPYVAGMNQAAAATARLTAAGKTTTAMGSQQQRVLNGGAASTRVFGTTAAGAAIGVTALAGAFAYAVTSAVEFDKTMRNVNSLSHLSDSNFAALEQTVLNLSKTLPQSANTLAEGLYDISSSGFQGAQGITVLNAAAKAASAGLSTTATSAKAITAVLNAYGLSANQASDVSDSLFQTVNVGVVSFDELSSQIGDVVGAAAAAKVPIDDVGSAIAAMTLAGISGAEATTSLNNLIRSLIKPSADLAKVYDQLGYSSGEQALQTDGLYGVMQKLQGVTGGSVSSWLKLIPEIRAARGAFALASADGENYRKTQAAISDESARAGATQRTLAEQARSAAFQWDILKNKVNAAGIEVGLTTIPTLVKAIGLVEQAGGRLQSVLLREAQALGPAWQAFGGALENIGRLAAGLGHDVEPFARGLAEVANGAVIGGVTALAKALETVTGILADHQSLVLAVGVAYGVTMARGFVVAAGGVGTLTKALQTNLLWQGLLAKQQLGNGLSALRTNAAYYGTAAVSIGAVTAVITAGIQSWTGYSHAASAASKAVAGASNAIKSGSLQNLRESADALQKQIGDYDAFYAKFDKQNYGEKFASTFKGLFTGDTGSRLATSGRIDDLKSQLQDVTNAAQTARENLTKYLEQGMTPQQRQVIEESGHFNEELDKLAATADKAGVTTTGAYNLMAGGLDAYNREANPTRVAQEQLTRAFGTMGKTADNAKSALDDLTSALDVLLGRFLTADESDSKFQQSLDDTVTNLKKARKENKNWSDTLNESTQVGRDNREQIRGMASALQEKIENDAKAGQSGKQLASSLRDGRKAILDQAAAAGLNRDAVKRLITQYGLTPALVKTVLETVGIDDAIAKARDLNTALYNLPSEKSVTIIGRYTAIGTPPPGIAAAVPKRAMGGPISGPGGPRDDMVPALLSNGEFVINAAATARHRSLLENINAQRFADGGFATNQAGLNAISGQLQTQVSIVTNVKSAAADVAKAVAEVKRLQQAWKDTADAIDQAKQRRELLRGIDVADRQHRDALKSKDKQDDKDTAAGAVEARKALRDFDAQAARSRQSNLIDARAASAEQRAEARATLAVNEAAFKFDKMSAADQLANLDKRIKGERQYSDQWVSDTQQRAQIQAQVTAEAQKVTDNQAQYEFDHMAAQDQLADIDRRLAAETQYSDAWVSLANQREQVQKQINDDAQAAIDKQKSAVDQQAQQLNGLLDQQAALTRQLDEAQATYNAAVANIKKARTDVLATVDLTQKPLVQPGTSITNLLRNANTSNAQFDEWVHQLALARRNGVSEAVIQSLGLDQGPQALGQLRQLNKASVDQVGQLNTAVATRRAQAGTQTEAEAASGAGAVAADIQAAADALISSQAELNGQLSALGIDQGRTYADAIAQGLASGQAGVRAAALALVGGASVLDQLRGVPAGTTASGFAVGGHVTGPGTGTSDSVPAWLSNGEFVVRAAAVQQHRSLLETINAGHYADGGYVSAGRIPSGTPSVNVSAEVETWALQMEVRRLGEALERQTSVIRNQSQQLTVAVGGV